MAKSKQRKLLATQQAEQSASWKNMDPEKRKEWSENRIKVAKSGYAKRQRERMNGAPMEARPYLAWHSQPSGIFRPDPAFAGWLKDFHKLTA